MGAQSGRRYFAGSIVYKKLVLLVLPGRKPASQAHLRASILKKQVLPRYYLLYYRAIFKPLGSTFGSTEVVPDF